MLPLTSRTPEEVIFHRGAEPVTVKRLSQRVKCEPASRLMRRVSATVTPLPHAHGA